MQTISPWFQTVQLINGIRKAYSEEQAPRDGQPLTARDARVQDRGRAAEQNAKRACAEN
jgi:hypothetical protein